MEETGTAPGGSGAPAGSFTVRTTTPCSASGAGAASSVGAGRGVGNACVTTGGCSADVGFCALNNSTNFFEGAENEGNEKKY